MTAPMRLPAGFTQDSVFQPLGNVGIPDPFFYAYYEDDFIPYNSALYTATLDGGTAAATVANGSGGRVLLTTGAASADFVGLQLTSAAFQYTATKKLAYLCRIQPAAIATTSFIAGLVETTATPATITDGIYFSYTAAGTTIQLIAVTGSTVIGTVSIPVAPVNGQDIDLGFVVDAKGNIAAWAGNNLLGSKVRQNFATLGPNAHLYALGNFSAATPALTGAITTALLNPTIAVFAASAAAATLVADLQFAGQER